MCDKVWHARLVETGVGDTGDNSSLTNIAGNCMWVFGDRAPGPRPEPSRFVAWPPPGFFPHTLMPSSGRWSFSDPDINFELGVNVSVVRFSDETELEVTVRLPSNARFGDKTIVFSHEDSAKQSPPKRFEVETYRVTVNFATSATARKPSSSSRSYDVIVFDADSLQPTSSSIEPVTSISPSTPPPVCTCPTRGLTVNTNRKIYNVQFEVNCNTGYRFRYCLTRNSTNSGSLSMRLLHKHDGVFLLRSSETVADGVRALSALLHGKLQLPSLNLAVH